MGKFVFGEFEVHPIQDRPSSMDISLFSGPLSDEERAAFMPGGSAPSSANMFLVKTGKQNILFDSGWGSAFEVKGKGAKALSALGVKPKDVDLVLITHVHPDHVLGLLKKSRDGAIVAAFPKARVMLSRAEHDSLLAPEAANNERTQRAAERLAMIREAYGERLTTFEFGESPAPGIRAIDASGHTKGHSAFMLQSGKVKLLVAGDFIHAAALQFPNPDECPTYDMNPEAAVKTRKALCEIAVNQSIPVAGMHLPFSGISYVGRNGRGGYSYTIVEF